MLVMSDKYLETLQISKQSSVREFDGCVGIYQTCGSCGVKGTHQSSMFIPDVNTHCVW